MLICRMHGGTLTNSIHSRRSANALDDLCDTLDPVAAGSCDVDNSRWIHSFAVDHRHCCRTDPSHPGATCDLVSLSDGRNCMDDIDVYSIPGFREPVNCLTHFLAACVFCVLSFYLAQRARGSWIRTASVMVMAFTSVFLLSMSTVYHLLGPGAGRDVMRKLDIAGIFALIAGTMTPAHTILIRGFYGWASLFLVWSAAITGITLRTIFSERLPPGAGIAIFLLFGWGGLALFILLWRRYGFLFVKPLLLGGLAYTAGAIFLSLDWPILIPRFVGPHEVWHVAVLVGLSLHWKFVFQFAHGPPSPPSVLSVAPNYELEP